MARRLALLALLACAAAAARAQPRVSSESNSESLDPFSLWDEYEESFETTIRPKPSSAKPTKVFLRNKPPKVNLTMKNTKNNDKKVIKTTTINIESHTNFLVTKKPGVLPKPYQVINRPLHPPYQLGEHQYVWLDAPGMAPVASSTVAAQRRPTTTRRPATTRKRRPPTTTKRRTTTQRRTTKPTKANINKYKTTCPPKRSEWLSTFFNGNKLRKQPKKPAKTGFFSTIYDWISKSLLNVSWFKEPKTKKPAVTTTTPATVSLKPDWFQNLLESEESDDGAYTVTETTNKKPQKKSPKKSYKGYQLLRAYPEAQWKVRDMLDLQEEAQGSGVMWWTPPSMNGSTDLLVPPDLLVDIKDHLKSIKIDYDVVIWDLQKAITYENPRLSKKQRIELEQLRGHPLTWRRYHRYADILRYLEYLQHSHSDLVELIPLGRSSEGLPLVAVKISLPSNETYIKDLGGKGYKKKWKLQSRMKPAVWLDGGSHAREWIAPAVSTWMLHTLVEGEKGLGADYDILKQADFYIMPVLNPDGYEHSHTHDRLWRKTRSRHPEHSDFYSMNWFSWNWDRTDCVGVDPDRNWDYHWNEQDSSKDPCSDTYAGPNPFSEPETRAVSEFLAENRGQIKVYISLHAYSQAWLVPSSHAHAPFADDGVLMEMGKLATAALADMYGTKYQVGTSAELRQPASGMSHDWAKARAGIKFAYHVDLRDSFGPYGFLLPGSQIVSTAKETWQAVKTIVDNLV